MGSCCCQPNVLDVEDGNPPIDPRSPGPERTPVVGQTLEFDPRSPAPDRTPGIRRITPNVSSMKPESKDEA